MPDGVTHKLTQAEIDNSRFYGATFARRPQMEELDREVAANKGTSNVMNQTVDSLNASIGIDGNMFKHPSLAPLRTSLIKGINKAVTSPSEETRAWGQWLSEPSRFKALMMPELNGEICRRDRKLDKELSEQEFEEDKNEIGAVLGGKNATFVGTEKETNSLIQDIDPVKKIIYKGDRNRRDNNSHWINSGMTMPYNGEEYSIYWMQEGAGTDASRKNSDKQFSWTPKLRAFHDVAIGTSDLGTVMDSYQALKTEARNKYTFKKDEKAEKFYSKVVSETAEWVNSYVQNRFFRLTSLMGMDFFVKRGNTVRFARDKDQENFTGTSVNRAITDSEWAHANEMGYLESGSVKQYGNRDRFGLKQSL